MLDLDKMLDNMREKRRKYVNDEGGVESNEGVHCPHCEHYNADAWEWGVYAEGEHNVSCDECGKDFVVTTEIEHTFIATKGA